MSARVGDMLGGKYELLELLGQGAMGIVFKARHADLHRNVAVKVLHPEVLHDPMAPARFQREARAASRLEHPNSVQIMDYGQDGDVFYIVMEFLEGQSLFDLVQAEGGRLDLRRTVDLMAQVCAALAVAHDAGIIHRDMKPENIMVVRRLDDDGVEREVVKVCDFGIAKIQAVELAEAPTQTGPAPAVTQLSTAGQICGTPAYMAPEQARSEPLDARCDIYACGVILYYLATNHVPFHAETPIGLLLQHLTVPPHPPSDLVAGVDPGLERVILTCLRKDREDRWGSARELRAALLELVQPGPSDGAARAVSGGSAGIGFAPTATPGVRASSPGAPGAPADGAMAAATVAQSTDSIQAALEALDGEAPQATAPSPTQVVAHSGRAPAVVWVSMVGLLAFLGYMVSAGPWSLFRSDDAASPGPVVGRGVTAAISGPGAPLGSPERKAPELPPGEPVGVPVPGAQPAGVVLAAEPPARPAPVPAEPERRLRHGPAAWTQPLAASPEPIDPHKISDNPGAGIGPSARRHGDHRGVELAPPARHAPGPSAP